MLSKVLLSLTALLLLFTEVRMLTPESQQTVLRPNKLELVQTNAETNTQAQSGVEATTDTECDPECMYKFPYLDGEDCGVPEDGEFEPQTGGEVTYVEPPVEEGEGNEREEFVLDSEGCYDFPVEPQPPQPHPPVEEGGEDVVPPITVNFPDTEEGGCATSPPPSSVYRYPFTSPGEGCPVDTEAEDDEDDGDSGDSVDSGDSGDDEDYGDDGGDEGYGDDGDYE